MAQKYQAIWHKLVIKKSFQEEVANLRKKLGIPPDGINSVKEMEFWNKQAEKRTNKQLAFEKGVGKIDNKFSAPFTDEGISGCFYFYTLFHF